MKYGLNLELTYEYKRFSFDSRSSTFEHNETGLTRKVVLDYFGNKLMSYAVEINKEKYLKGVYNDFNELLGIFYKEKIGPNEPDRKDFIKKYQLIIDDITIKILTNPLNMNEDFDFDELDEALVEQATQPTTTYNCPVCQSGLIRSDCIKDKIYYWKCTDGVKCKAIFSDIKGKPHERLKNDFTNEANTEEPDNLDDLFSGDFDFESDSSSNEDIPILKDFVTKEEIKSKSKDCDVFDFSEFDNMDAEEPLTNAPTFMFSGAGYTLFISFNHMTFKATGGDENIVYALQNLATLVFINHKFLTAKNHPEWLYSSFEDDLKQIFDKLTTGFTYLNDKERDIADSFIESSMYHAVLNYRNRLGYYKYHKPFVFEHE